MTWIEHVCWLVGSQPGFQALNEWPFGTAVMEKRERDLLAVWGLTRR